MGAGLTALGLHTQVHSKQGKNDEALQAYQTVLEVEKRVFGPQSAQVAAILQNMATVRVC